MINKISFNGIVNLSPKVEKTIREKEYFLLRDKFRNEEQDVYINNRNVLENKGKERITEFQGFYQPSQKPFYALTTTQK